MIPPTPANGPADSRFTLTTLGDAALHRLSVAAAPQRVLDAGKPLALLVYLTCALGREAHRDHLCDLLWSQMEPDAARRALRATLHLLRAKTGLGKSLFEARGDRVALSAPVETDRDALLGASASGDVEAVVRIYSADFLTGFAAPGGVQFDLWARAERDRLRQVFTHSAEEVVRTRLASGRARDALTLARRVRDLDPFSQAAWRRVLECCVASGDTVAARIEWQALEQFFQVEGMEPERATRAAIDEAQRINGHAPTNANGDNGDAQPGLVAELVGRDREFATLTRAWDDARRGHTTHFHLSAAAGLGKTRLLLDLRTRIRSIGGSVVYVRANSAARDIDYAFASEVAAAIGRLRGAGGISTDSASALVALNPTLASVFTTAHDTAVGDEALRRRALALREMIEAVAEEKPVALLLDDLHWSDAYSRRVLAAALSPIERAHLMVVVAARPYGGDEADWSGSTPLTLAALGENDVGALISSIGSLPSESWASALPVMIWTATDGSPLLIMETLQLLVDQSSLAMVDGTWQVGSVELLFASLGQKTALRRRIEQLETSQRNVLALLALAGGNMSKEMLMRATGRAADELTASLVGLEQRGFLLHPGDAVSIAHDEYAATAIASSAPELLQHLSSVLGRFIADGAGDDARTMCLAGSLLAQGDGVELRRLVRLGDQFVRASRQRGDHRPNRSLIAELVGPSAPPSLQRFLVQSLPWHVRLGLVTRQRVAAALAMAVLLIFATPAAWFALTRPTPPPTAVLAVYQADKGGTAIDVHEVSLQQREWDAADDIEVDLTRKPTWKAGPAGLYTAGIRPDGSGWTTWRAMPDSGGLDIYEYRVDGDHRRITFAVHDDMQPTWAPDNSRFAFVTSRWNALGQYDIAVFNAATRTGRPLTSGNDRDQNPVWSPDGSRIAFLRDLWSGGRVLCVIDADGGGLRCLHSRFGNTHYLARWLDSHRMVAAVDEGTTRRVVVIDVDRGEESVLEEETAEATASPDGRWIVCLCTRRGHRPKSWMVYPVGNPDRFKLLNIRGANGDEPGRVSVTWAPRSPRSPYLDTLRIGLGFGTPTLGTSHQLRAIGVDTHGRAVDPGIIRWRSLDTIVATVDSEGRLTSRREGRVTIEASAGGWRHTRADIVIEPNRDSLLLDERWESMAPNWISFGEPRPVVVTNSRLGRAFKNNGDDNFFSGAYTARNFDASRGLWAEADVSLRLTAEHQQQDQALLVFQVSDSLPYRNWDHRTGERTGPTPPQCRIYAPAGDGAHRGDSLDVEGVLLPAPRSMRSGAPLRVLVQLLPDGRCGMAVDGRAIWIGPRGFTSPTVKVELEGRSMGTDVLVGRLRVHSGVAPHIRWETRP